ncbi:MAG: hypothetical protein BWX92_03640 [Deltaproteobacteria bacterium ADurb.Bin135]|nr:MAG: hypothetical protein BWX92_03640 [Deltaproteobacteria bacterium ADurb.Bin135]
MTPDSCIKSVLSYISLRLSRVSIHHNRGKNKILFFSRFEDIKIINVRLAIRIVRGITLRDSFILCYVIFSHKAQSYVAGIQPGKHQRCNRSFQNERHKTCQQKDRDCDFTGCPVAHFLPKKGCSEGCQKQWGGHHGQRPTAMVKVQHTQCDPISASKKQEQCCGIFYQNCCREPNSSYDADDRSSICIEVFEIVKKIASPTEPIRTEVRGSGFQEDLLPGSIEMQHECGSND